MVAIQRRPSWRNDKVAGAMLVAAMTRPAAAGGSAPDRHATPGHGGRVPAAFWAAALALTVAIVARVPLDGHGATLLFTALFLIGGLPHGAYDIALLRRAAVWGRGQLALAVGGYVALAIGMAALWQVAPLLALIAFLAIAAGHFAGDWPMLEEPLLRFAAGAAVIAAPAIGQREAVAAIFVAMSDARGVVLAQLAAAAAPVALLVTAVGIAVAWRQGGRAWAAAMAVCLILLMLAPPVAGFALFFVFLHSPSHLAPTRERLRDVSRARWIATGAVLSIAAVGGWAAITWLWSGGRPAMPDPTAQAFQLLAAVAVPHLALTGWLDRRLAETSPRSVARGSGARPIRVISRTRR